MNIINPITTPPAIKGTSIKMKVNKALPNPVLWITFIILISTRKIMITGIIISIGFGPSLNAPAEANKNPGDKMKAIINNWMK